MLRSIVPLALCSAAFGAAIVGCGSGGGQKSLTKAGFVRQASAICTEAAGKLSAALFSGGSVPDSDSDLVNKDVVPIFQSDLLDPIEALGSPHGDEAKVKAILAAGREAVASLKRNPHLIRFVQVDPRDPFLRFNRLAKAYGLGSCAR